MGVPSKDTIKICDDSGFVSSTPERKYVYNIQTPQTFRTEIIADAYKVALKKKFSERTMLLWLKTQDIRLKLQREAMII